VRPGKRTGQDIGERIQIVLRDQLPNTDRRADERRRGGLKQRRGLVALDQLDAVGI
jgi:hypothetical protein